MFYQFYFARNLETTKKSFKFCNSDNKFGNLLSAVSWIETLYWHVYLYSLANRSFTIFYSLYTLPSFLWSAVLFSLKHILLNVVRDHYSKRYPDISTPDNWPPWNSLQDNYTPDFCPLDNYPLLITPGRLSPGQLPPMKFPPGQLPPRLLPPGQLLLNNSSLDNCQL